MSSWIERLAARRAAHRERSRLYRFAFTLAGAIVTLAGIAMLLLPGPALVVIPIGLGMLAMEFAWAERMLVRVAARAERAQAGAKELTPVERALTIGAVVLALAAVAATVLLVDVPLLPDG